MIMKYVKLIIYMISFLFSKNRKSKIIYYHDISNKYTDMGTDFDLFKIHINIIRKEKFDIVKKISTENNQIMICFDDGWAGIYEVKDYFISEKIFPTIFIALDLIGKEGYLDISQILELQELGFIFESHAWSHTNLSLYNNAELKKELLDSRIKLSEILNKNVDSICFPQGYFTSNVLKLSNEYGYKNLYSSVSGSYYDLIEKKNIICRNLVQFSSSLFFKLQLFTSPQYIQKRSLKIHTNNETSTN